MNERLRERLLEYLDECWEYFDDRADVIDGDYGESNPNREMRLADETAFLISELDHRVSHIGEKLER